MKQVTPKPNSAPSTGATGILAPAPGGFACRGRGRRRGRRGCVPDVLRCARAAAARAAGMRSAGRSRSHHPTPVPPGAQGARTCRWRGCRTPAGSPGPRCAPPRRCRACAGPERPPRRVGSAFSSEGERWGGRSVRSPERGSPGLPLRKAGGVKGSTGSDGGRVLGRLQGRQRARTRAPCCAAAAAAKPQRRPRCGKAAEAATRAWACCLPGSGITCCCCAVAQCHGAADTVCVCVCVCSLVCMCARGREARGARGWAGGTACLRWPQRGAAPLVLARQRTPGEGERLARRGQDTPLTAGGIRQVEAEGGGERPGKLARRYTPGKAQPKWADMYTQRKGKALTGEAFERQYEHARCEPEKLAPGPAQAATTAGPREGAQGQRRCCTRPSGGGGRGAGWGGDRGPASQKLLPRRRA